jgi:GTP-dependent phosphoenolpyruvate carboxykinase
MNSLQAIPGHTKLGKLQPPNQFVLDWVQKTAAIVQPENIFWCDGSEAERDHLYAEAVTQGVLVSSSRPRQARWPGWLASCTQTARGHTLC